MNPIFRTLRCSITPAMGVVAWLLFGSHATIAAPSVIRVVLLGGQSNADGRAAGAELPTAPVNLQQPQPNVPFYAHTHGAAVNADGTLGSLATLRPGATQMPSGGFGPEIQLGYDLSRVFEQTPGTALAIIKYAKGGSSLHTDLRPGGSATTAGDGPHYQTFQKVVTDGLAKLRATYPAATIELAGMAWVQGESDIIGTAAQASAYAANLTAFIADLRLTFKPALPFFFSRISDNQTVYSNPADPDYPNYLTVRARQAEVAAGVAGAYMIEIDSAAFAMNSDLLHFNGAGQRAIGAAFAARMAGILVLKVTCQRTPGGLQLNWNAIPGKSYRVHKSSDLSSWTSQTAGMTGQWSVPLEQNPPRRFFRVEEE